MWQASDKELNSASTVIEREIHQVRQKGNEVMSSESISLEVNLAPLISEAQVAKDSVQRNLQNIFQVLVTKYLRRR